MNLELENKTVLVTGAAQGIGREIAAAFYQEGARVVLLDLNGSKLKAACAELDTGEERVLGLECDVTKEPDVVRCIEKVFESYGTVDVVVNNAGIGIPAPIQEMTLESWEKVFSVNMTGVFLLSKHAFARMMEQKSGVILSIGSFAGKRGTLYGDNTSYSASKAGVIGFSKALAIEGARHGIRVLSVCPGVVDTEILQVHSPERRAAMASMIPVNRMAKPREIADVIVFLCSARAGYITGEITDVNGGLYMD